MILKPRWFLLSVRWSSLRCMDSSLSSDERQELVNTAIEESERLNQFISNILDMTRIESGELTPKKDWIDVHSLFADAIQRQSHLLKKHRVTIEDPGVPFLIHVDAGLFPQVIHNLLENATKYTPEASNIRLAADIQNNQVTLSISDDGPGIPVSLRDKVFDKFTRIEQRDARIAGTGLGLAICKAIVEIHGGTIVIDSPISGHGTRVEITLNDYQLLEKEMKA